MHTNTKFKIPYTKYIIDIVNMKITLDNIDVTNNITTDDGNIIIRIFNIDIIKPMQWVIDYSVSNIIIDEKYPELLNSIIFVSNKPHGLSNTKQVLPLFDKPITITYNGIIYRRYSIDHTYAVSNKGEVFSTYRNSAINGSYNDYKYVVHKLKKNYVHRMVAIAWIDNDDFITNNIVDHIDSNKHNNHVNNLRWTNNSKNIKFINSGDVGYLVKNNKTNEVIKLTTMHEVCSHIGRSIIDIKNQPLDNGKLWTGINGVYEIATDTKKHKWENTTTYKKRVPKKNSEYQIMNIMDGKISNIKSFQKLLNIINGSKSTIIKYLRHNITNRPINNFLIRHKSDDPWDGIIITTKNASKRVIDDKGITYRSIRHAGVVNNLSDKTIAKYISKGKIFKYV